MHQTSRRPLESALLAGFATLLASAALVEYLSRRAVTAHKPLGKTLRIGGRNLHLIDRGTGPPVVLLHGNGSMVEDFASSGIIATLAQNHRVIAIDRPGFGLSERENVRYWTPEREADLIADALSALGVERPVIVAHSWATMVALSLALRDPSAVAGLVLVSGYYYPSTRLDVAMQTPASLPLLGNVLRHTVWPLVGRLTSRAAIKNMFAPMPVPREFLEQYSVPMANRPSQLKSVADDTVFMPRNARRLMARYAEIQVPVRIIAGAEDKIVTTARQSARLQLELHNSELQILEGAGHMAHHARPDLVVSAVEEFFSAGPSLQPGKSTAKAVAAE